MTPTVTTTPYCTAQQLLVFYDAGVVADTLRATAESPRPTRLSLLDSTRDPGQTLNQLLLAATGQINAAVLMKEQYQIADLQALLVAGGDGAIQLQRITAGLTMWRLQQRLKPGTADPNQVPGVTEALDDLKALKSGDAIFGFLEAANAGIAEVSSPDLSQLETKAAVVTAARRFFGSASCPAGERRIY